MTDHYKEALGRADSFDRWARVLEAHEPEKSAAGIVMLRDGAKVIRLQAALIKELETSVKNLVARL